MRDLLLSASGGWLNLADYDADFAKTVESVDGPILKTERIQTFREPGNPSWEAFAAGQWDEALRIAARPNPVLSRFFADLHERGSGLHRLRIVSPPFTPYLIWELHVLRHRAKAGERIRVLDAGLVAGQEQEHGQVPELLVVGSRAVYEVRYDASGTPVGAEKFVEPAVVEGCGSHVTTLLDMAEPFESFFDRQVRGITPPAVTS